MNQQEYDAAMLAVAKLRDGTDLPALLADFDARLERVAAARCTQVRSVRTFQFLTRRLPNTDAVTAYGVPSSAAELADRLTCDLDLIARTERDAAMGGAMVALALARRLLGAVPDLLAGKGTKLCPSLRAAAELLHDWPVGTPSEALRGELAALADAIANTYSETAPPVA
jgi:hypothetical protein